MPAYTIKLCVVGNVGVGKSRFVNALTSTPSDTAYQATVGCRILEYDTEITGVSVDGKHREQFEVTIECWDISGDTKYQKGWPAMKQECHGVIIMFDPTTSNESDLAMWRSQFAGKCPSTILSVNRAASESDIHCEFEGKTLSQDTMQGVMQWIGIVFGHHPDAEIGVFD